MGERPKILLIDDDIDFLTATRTVLEKEPYDVIVAEEGNKGMQLAATEKPDLILLDIIMPFKDGFTVAEQLKKDPELRKIPVCMLTSFSSRRGEVDIPRSRGYSLETEDYVEKPISPQELLATVKRLLKR